MRQGTGRPDGSDIQWKDIYIEWRRSVAVAHHEKRELGTQRYSALRADRGHRGTSGGPVAFRTFRASPCAAAHSRRYISIYSSHPYSFVCAGCVTATHDVRLARNARTPQTLISNLSSLCQIQLTDCTSCSISGNAYFRSLASLFELYVDTSIYESVYTSLC